MRKMRIFILFCFSFFAPQFVQAHPGVQDFYKDSIENQQVVFDDSSSSNLSDNLSETANTDSDESNLYLGEESQIALEESVFLQKEIVSIFSKIFLTKYLLKILNNANSYKQDSGKDTYPVIDIGALIVSVGGPTLFVKRFPGFKAPLKKDSLNAEAIHKKNLINLEKTTLEINTILNKNMFIEEISPAPNKANRISFSVGDADKLALKKLNIKLNEHALITNESLRIVHDADLKLLKYKQNVAIKEKVKIFGGQVMRTTIILAGVTLFSYELSKLGTIVLSKESIEDYLLKTQKWHDELLSSLELISL